MESAWAINSKNSYAHFRSANNFTGCHLHLKAGRPFFSSLRILMTTDTHSEVWSYSLELAEAFHRKGHQVTLAAPGGSLSREQRRQLRRLPRMEVFENPHLLAGANNAHATRRWLLHLERQVQPHLIHLNGYAHATLPWQAPKVVAMPICLLSWWQTSKKRTAPLLESTYQEYVKRSLQAADLVLVPTQTLLASLEESYGPLPQSRVVPVGRNPYPVHVTQKHPYVLTTSQGWDDHQNVVNLERVAPRLTWPIYILGNDHLPRRDNSHQWINPIGQVSAKKRRTWFSQAAIYALPTRYEPFGLAVLEAAMADCALVLGDIPNLREVWGDTALYVPPDDPQALEVALSLLMADSNYRKLMAKRAYTHAQKFTAERMVEQFLTYCRGLVSFCQPAI